MDFFQREDRARKHTTYLVFLFLLAIIGIVLAIYTVIALYVIYQASNSASHGYNQLPDGSLAPLPGLWNPPLFESVAFVVLAIVLGGCLVRMSELRDGGSAIASMLRARPVDINTSDLDERKLLNVVEEMSIASGTPVPQVFVMNDEQGINACAAGYSRSDTAVIVSRGAIVQLSRDELQGVIAHEYSHICNGDMRLNMRLLALIFGIICIAEIGRILLTPSRYGNGRGAGSLFFFGLAIMAIGGIGVFFGKMIQAAISRQREFLADASAVQYTRNPNGIGGALKKIGGYSFQSYLETGKAPQVSHFFFGDPVASSWFTGVFATHPPLPDRIRAIDPSFNGDLSGYVSVPSSSGATVPLAASVTDLLDANALSFRDPSALPTRSLIPAPIRERTTAPLSKAVPTVPRSTIGSVGQPDEASLNYARALKANLPESLITASRETVGAGALIYAVILSREPLSQEQQLKALKKASSPTVYNEIVSLMPAVFSLSPSSRLPLVDLSIPALRQLSPGQYQQFRDGIDMLIECDHKLGFFEFVVQKIVCHTLDPYFKRSKRPAVIFNSLQPLAPDFALVLSMFAYLPKGTPDQIQSAFDSGTNGLDIASGTVTLIDYVQCNLNMLDKALLRFSQASLPVTQALIEAASRIVLHDSNVDEEEFEMLRAVASALDCPIPPAIQK